MLQFGTVLLFLVNNTLESTYLIPSSRCFHEYHTIMLNDAGTQAQR
jgi:hypothetical protein